MTQRLNDQMTRLPDSDIEVEEAFQGICELDSATESGIQPFTTESLGVDEQVRLGDDIEPDGTNALAHRVGELMMMAEQVQAWPHRGDHFVDHGLARVDAPAGRIKRSRRFVRHEEIDSPEPLTREHFFAHEVPPFVVAAFSELEPGART